VLLNDMRLAHIRNEMTPAGFGAQTGMTVMTAPLATLAILVTLWLVTIVMADMLNHGLSKVIAALKGRSALATAPAIRPIAIRVSQRSRPQRTLHVAPQLRAAA
jgi:hypothetical protein